MGILLVQNMAHIVLTTRSSLNGRGICGGFLIELLQTLPSVTKLFPRHTCAKQSRQRYVATCPRGKGYVTVVGAYAATKQAFGSTAMSKSSSLSLSKRSLNAGVELGENSDT